MKKIKLSILFALLFSANLNLTYAQVYGQDSDGYTNIIVPSSQLSLDIANNIAIFEYLSFTSDDKYLLGGRVSGKSENGSSILFSDEKIAANSTIDLLAGVALDQTLNSNQDKVLRLFATMQTIDKDKIGLIENLENFVANMQETEEDKSYSDIIKNLKKNAGELKSDEISDAASLKAIVDEITKHYLIDLRLLKNKIYKTPDNEALTNLKSKSEDYYREIQSRFTSILEKNAELEESEKKYIDYKYTDRFINHLFFLRGGFTGNGLSSIQVMIQQLSKTVL